MEKPVQEAVSVLPHEGDIKEVDGVKYRYTDSGYLGGELDKDHLAQCFAFFLK